MARPCSHQATIRLIDAGSDNPYDSDLSYTFAGGGVYYLRVDNYPGNVPPAAGSTYTLNISLEQRGVDESAAPAQRSAAATATTR